MENQMQPSQKKLLDVVGPGILYAAAAVGISHLVQATRAGAGFGLSLTFVIVAACIVKYPSLRFGGIYSAATGDSLIKRYREEGLLPFWAYALTELMSMVFIIAAVALFTSGLIQAAFGFKVNALLGVSVLLTGVTVMLITGKYNVMEKLTKVIVGIFTILIIISTVLVVDKIEWSLSAFVLPEMNARTLAFIVALIGFMPTPTEGSVLQSVWTCVRAEQMCKLPSQKDAALDFNVGFIVTVILALCFMLLGAGVMHSAGVEVVTDNFGFCRQLFELFTKVIGEWSFPLIAIASIFVMFSTVYSVLDGMTRITSAIIIHGIPESKVPKDRAKLYNVICIGLSVASVLLLATAMESFAMFMDLTCVVTFIISPVLAILNHRSVFSDNVPVEMQPGLLMRWWSLIGITVLTLLSLVYLYSRLLN